MTGLDPLARTERLIVKAEGLITRQSVLVERERERGVVTTRAEMLLDLLNDHLANLHRQRLAIFARTQAQNRW